MVRPAFILVCSNHLWCVFVVCVVCVCMRVHAHVMCVCVCVRACVCVCAGVGAQCPGSDGADAGDGERWKGFHWC